MPCLYKKRFKYVEISLTPNQSIEDTINIMFDDFHIHKGSPKWSGSSFYNITNLTFSL
jgi:hypothetical protein